MGAVSAKLNSVPPAVAGGARKFMVWNDADFPQAYFISFRAYGTWLHGDEGGSVDRHNNAYGSPKYSKAEHWNEISKARLKQPPVKLDAKGAVQLKKR